MESTKTNKRKTVRTLTIAQDDPFAKLLCGAHGCDGPAQMEVAKEKNIKK
jgi:hypothetical protein